MLVLHATLERNKQPGAMKYNSTLPMQMPPAPLKAIVAMQRKTKSAQLYQPEPQTKRRKQSGHRHDAKTFTRTKPQKAKEQLLERKETSRRKHVKNRSNATIWKRHVTKEALMVTRRTRQRNLNKSARAWEKETKNKDQVREASAKVPGQMDKTEEAQLVNAIAAERKQP